MISIVVFGLTLPTVDLKHDISIPGPRQVTKVETLLGKNAAMKAPGTMKESDMPGSVHAEICKGGAKGRSTHKMTYSLLSVNMCIINSFHL